MKKILIVYAQAGNGHKRAAFAVKEAFNALQPNTEVACVDILLYFSFLYKKIYELNYLFFSEYIPSIYNLFYNFFESKQAGRLFRDILEMLESLQSKKFKKLVETMKPDIIISTHFLTPHALSSIKDKTWRGKQIMIMTDYGHHAIWTHPLIDHYFVATPELKNTLAQNFDIPSSSITASGIPISQAFNKTLARDHFQKKYNLNPQYKTLLFLSGRLSNLDLIRYIKKMINNKSAYNIIAICGTNYSLKEKLKKLSPKGKNNFLVLGFVKNMEDWMNISDIIITKPGGLTLSEGSSLEKPFILISPVPKQEQKNAEFFRQKGAATIIRNEEELELILEDIFHSPAKLQNMSKASRKLGRVEASRQIVEEIIKLER
ncbi:MAG: UDP-N-acetylglucosamine:LPS N-acetylglucosamine transferase [Parcubacteria group bacterium Gr01-1014_18]|nr:MAG: UDP-N-acetylglucosamine:LPS N-acetylglucosamine transferase [Parcubacteria group bacterium Greene0416_36]TSC79757.1 MAG: UDP-N-acetylglucosamine:LPS N-acetylglucosamine transferase [Parcubacteria group bacterium Gr01-1014_18]TSC97907.1 MAG: UDP-N-acetylglucosamine:LPS N-acetylglucosamine transferase [Parcubacteria group bacterium Greene1014_20]TSD06565.1 MAG: UDP-N-acetylglucosamine:LPS N-acetylglucosamine transferase [Parcubacteria group bacterium Greene0714_2]